MTQNLTTVLYFWDYQKKFLETHLPKDVLEYVNFVRTNRNSWFSMLRTLSASDRKHVMIYERIKYPEYFDINEYFSKSPISMLLRFDNYIEDKFTIPTKITVLSKILLDQNLLDILSEKVKDNLRSVREFLENITNLTHSEMLEYFNNPILTPEVLEFDVIKELIKFVKS